MNGIDISRWQPANVTSLVKDYDFVIIKATEGTSYVSPFCDTQYQQAKARGKKLGVYHFASGLDARAEAEYFVNNVKGYVGEAVLVLDWEAGVISRGREWVRTFVKRVKELTGVNAMIYGSASPLQAHAIPALATEEDCGLWVAAYPNNNVTGYRDEPQMLGSVIRQYSSKGRLADYGGDLDLNRSILTPAMWDAYAGGGKATPSPSPEASKKSNDTVAREVLAGAWGNGEDRKNRLSGAGYNPSDIQALVNGLLGNVTAKKSNEDIASEVIGGLWGDGDTRKKRLADAGYDYGTIQGIVNNRVGVSQARYHKVASGENLSVIAGKYGTNWQYLAKLNNLANPNVIYAGQSIRIS